MQVVILFLLLKRSTFDFSSLFIPMEGLLINDLTHCISYLAGFNNLLLKLRDAFYFQMGNVREIFHAIKGFFDPVGI